MSAAFIVRLLILTCVVVIRGSSSLSSLQKAEPAVYVFMWIRFQLVWHHPISSYYNQVERGELVCHHRQQQQQQQICSTEENKLL